MSNKNMICVIIIVVILLLILGICLAFMLTNNKLIKGGRRSFWENDSSNPLKTDDKCFETFEKIIEFITKNDKLSIVIANMPVYTCAKAYSPVIFVDPSNSEIRSDGYSEKDISFIWAKMTSDEFFEYISTSDIAMKNKILMQAQFVNAPLNLSINTRFQRIANFSKTNGMAIWI
jgi:hypothetical protein